MHACVRACLCVCVIRGRCWAQRSGPAGCVIPVLLSAAWICNHPHSQPPLGEQPLGGGGGAGVGWKEGGARGWDGGVIPCTFPTLPSLLISCPFFLGGSILLFYVTSFSLHPFSVSLLLPFFLYPGRVQPDLKGKRHCPWRRRREKKSMIDGGMGGRKGKWGKKTVFKWLSRLFGPNGSWSNEKQSQRLWLVPMHDG